jgi:hypothetical protein
MQCNTLYRVIIMTKNRERTPNQDETQHDTTRQDTKQGVKARLETRGGKTRIKRQERNETR